jgi:hypothetical protein
MLFLLVRTNAAYHHLPVGVSQVSLICLIVRQSVTPKRLLTNSRVGWTIRCVCFLQMGKRQSDAKSAFERPEKYFLKRPDEYL